MEFTPKLISIEGKGFKIAPKLFKDNCYLKIHNKTAKKIANLKIQNNVDILRQKGEYFVYVLVEVKKPPKTTLGVVAGVELGIRTLATVHRLKKKCMHVRIQKMKSTGISIVNQIVQKMYRGIMNIPRNEGVQENKPVVTIDDILKDGRALEFASPELRGSKDIVIKAIQNKIISYKFASEEMKQNEEVLAIAFAIDPEICMQWTSDTIKDNKAKILDIVAKKGSLLKYVSTRLRQDMEVVMTAIQNDPTILDSYYISESMKLSVLKERGDLYQYLKFSLLKHPDALRYALQSNDASTYRVIPFDVLEYEDWKKYIIGIELNRIPPIDVNNMHFWFPYLRTIYTKGKLAMAVLQTKVPFYLRELVEEYMRSGYLNLENPNWTFPMNRALYIRKPFYYAMEVLGDREYPVFVIPKGIYLYTYSQNDPLLDDATMIKSKLLNVYHEPIEESLKFFYPIPYIASHGVFGKSYDMCYVCKTTREIRLLCMIAPSPLNRQDQDYHGMTDITNYKNVSAPYYPKNFMYRDSFRDPHINKEFQQKYDIQGYMAIAQADSFSHGEKWEDFRGKRVNGFTQDVLKTAIYKSAFNARENTLPMNSFFHWFTSINATYGIPEVVLSPLATTYFNHVTNLHEKNVDELRLFMNYECVDVVRHLEDLPKVIHKKAVCEFNPYPLFHMDRTLVSNCHPMTLWNELTPNHLDFQSSTSKCKIETVGHYLISNKKTLAGTKTRTLNKTTSMTIRKYVLRLKRNEFEKYKFGKYEYWFAMSQKIPIIYIK